MFTLTEYLLCAGQDPKDFYTLMFHVFVEQVKSSVTFYYKRCKYYIKSQGCEIS